MASWTAPKTWNVGDVLTAGDMNTYVRDNTTFLSSIASAYVAATESTSSTSYTDLGTVGPAVTVTTGAHAIVIVSTFAEGAALGGDCAMSAAVSGASTIAASTTYGALQTNPSSVAGAEQSATGVYLYGGTATGALTPGVNTFTAKYANPSTGGAQFRFRSLTVIPLP